MCLFILGFLECSCSCSCSCWCYIVDAVVTFFSLVVLLLIAVTVGFFPAKYRTEKERAEARGGGGWSVMFWLSSRIPGTRHVLI